jgi:hypothetical protein
MVARKENFDEGPCVGDVRARSDSQLAKQYNPANFESHDDFAHEFPGTHLRLTGGRLDATVHWPAASNTGRLAELLSHYRESDEGAPIELLFKIINDDLAKAGRETWTPRDFAMVAAEVDDALEARADADADRLVVPVPGRRKSQTTYMVQKICETLGCGQRFGYYILRDGTGKLDQQKALALAFSNDPDRRLPRNWALKNGRTWGSPTVHSFTRYVLDRIDRDAYEDTAFSAALAILAPRFDEGWLLDANELECLLRTIREQAMPITAEVAVDLWARYDQWKRRRF